MTELQLTEIRNYLLAKKLPIDILLEVQDHFVSQIHVLEHEESFTFNQAFEIVKKSWKKELNLYWNGSWDLQDRSKFIRKMNKANFYSLAKESFKYTFLIYVSLLLLAKFFSFDIYKYIFMFIAGSIFLLPVVNYVRNLKRFRLPNKFPKYTLVSVQEYTVLSLTMGYAYFKIMFLGFDLPKIFAGIYEEHSLIGVAFFGVILFLLLFGSVLTYLSQKLYLKRIGKVVPFLKYL